MVRKTLASRLFFRVCCLVLYLVAASVSFNGYYDKWHFGEDGVSGEDDRFQFEMMMDGTAFRPNAALRRQLDRPRRSAIL